ncbi:MAG: hypothetical protein DRI57_28615 [Deltaproteobacteria bacterium]|nr:MAG: hypothetical protein DRI57_28615 [Deltaproteobacteria bacterium]
MFHQVLIIEYSDVTVSKLGIYQERPKRLGIKAFSGVRKIHFNPHLSQGRVSSFPDRRLGTRIPDLLILSESENLSWLFFHRPLA